MRKLYSLFISVFFFQNYIVAQNYQTVQSETEYYFADSVSGNIKAIKIASAVFNGTDSILTNFFVARDTGDYCIWATAPSWIGKEIFIRNNGFNIFYNSDNDSIFINTLATLNETWTLYTFPNGDYIEANILSNDTATIISTIDSIKTASLQTKNNLGNNISHVINGREIKFSKNHGFIQLPEFYEFPENSTRDYKKINAHRLTFGEVFNFEINDSYYYQYTYSDPNSPSDYGVSKILTKHYSFNSDSVFYKIENTFVNNEVDWNPQPHMVTTIAVDTINSYFTHLDSLIYYDIMPEETLIDTSEGYGGVHSYNMSTFLMCGIRIKQSFDYGWDIEYDDFYECFSSVQNFTERYVDVASLGNVYFNSGGDGTGVIVTKSMYGYIKGNDTCGTNFVTGIESIEQSEGIIFPNPTNNIVNINTEKEDSYILEFSNNLGQILVTDNFKGKLYELSLNQFPNGLYFLSLTNSRGYRQIYKLIKE